jgi:hypothetical protein
MVLLLYFSLSTFLFLNIPFSKFLFLLLFSTVVF